MRDVTLTGAAAIDGTGKAKNNIIFGAGNAKASVITGIGADNILPGSCPH